MLQDERLSVTYMDDRVNDESFGRYLTALAGDIDAAPEQQRAVLYDTPNSGTIDAARRRALAQVLEARMEKLGRITAGYVMVAPSPIVRGVLTAVFWISPPPYECRVVATEEEGFGWLGERCSWLEPSASLARYQAQKLELLARMKHPRAP